MPGSLGRALTGIGSGRGRACGPRRGFVTIKTVETHLGHVYAKLGIASREALPAELGETERIAL